MATRQTPPNPLQRGWQPSPQKTPTTPDPKGGYQPTTGEQKPVEPPPKEL